MYYEKRNTGRIKRKDRIRLTLFPLAARADLPVSVETLVVDVSKGGICVDIPFVFEKGQKARVQMQLPTTNIGASRFMNFESEGIVRWSKNDTRRGWCRIGVEFVNTRKVSLDLWHDFISRYRAHDR